jgi:hypothetical protein
MLDSAVVQGGLSVNAVRITEYKASNGGMTAVMTNRKGFGSRQLFNLRYSRDRETNCAPAD